MIEMLNKTPNLTSYLGLLITIAFIIDIKQILFLH